MTVRLFVGNLPYDVTEAELRAHFTAMGPLSSLALPTDRDTGKPRGFAFVEFRERTDAEEAIRRLNNQLRIEMAKWIARHFRKCVERT